MANGESIARPMSVPHVADDASPLPDRVHSWIVTVDHKRLGLMYVLYGILFMVIAGLEATAMRIQLAVPNNHFVSPQVFNQLFTMHGTTMVFLVGMPIIFGLANYLVPLMIGARDMAFPRLNAFSFWMSALGGVILYFSLIGGSGLYGAGNAPDVGWFAYAPLTSPTFSVGHSTDYWIVGLLVSGIGSVGTAANIVTTVLCMRCPGMTLGRMPMLAWLNLVVSGLVLIVISPKPIFGYSIMVAASLAIGFLSLGVWAHHMFTVGMPSSANAFFAASTMAVGVPTGIKIFNWLGTMWGGKVSFAVPMRFCVAFLFQFLIAGLTGIMLSASPFDWQLGNSYFVVAHFHYVLIGGLIFTLFAGLYYWYPKVTGRMWNDALGRAHFWLFLIGFHLTFDFMHVPGVLGMPRRIYTYEAGRGWEMWNLVVSIGVVFQIAGILCWVTNFIWSYFNGPAAGNDPWDAWTLEWSTTSPPPEYNFGALPVVASSRPLWDAKHPEDPDWKYQ